MIISLIGLPGCGKTSVGLQLARRLQLEFFDSDALIKQQIGCSISEFFAREGEACFRDIEAAVIDELSQKATGVLSTGGGAILRQQNRLNLRARTTVVYLEACIDELWRRLRNDRQRPLLQVANPLARLRELYCQRHPLYQQTAHLHITTGGPSVEVPVNAILARLALDDASAAP